MLYIAHSDMRSSETHKTALFCVSMASLLIHFPRFAVKFVPSKMTAPTNATTLRYSTLPILLILLNPNKFSDMALKQATMVPSKGIHTVPLGVVLRLNCLGDEVKKANQLSK
jgi:hypothetical protein